MKREDSGFEDWDFVEDMVHSSDIPLTGICIVADKNRCPPGFTAISKAGDDPSVEADVWKDGIFTFTRVIRYIAISNSVQQNAFVTNVVQDIAIINHGDLVPPGFVALENTADTRDKALRKKQLCVRSVARDTAVDAVCDVQVLVRQKKPPNGYTLAGEIDGCLICFKYGVIPKDFPSGSSHTESQPSGVVAGLPYPIHPSSSQQNGGGAGGEPIAQHRPSTELGNRYAQMSLNRQISAQGSSSMIYGIDGVPFQLNPKLGGGQQNSQALWPNVKPVTPVRLETEFSYPFAMEQAVLETSFTN